MTYLQMLKAMPERNLCLQSTCNSQKLKDKKKKQRQKQTSSRAKMKHDIGVIYPWDLEMEKAKKKM